MSSAIRAAQDAYVANADYDGDLTKTKAFVAACRKLLLMPSDSRGVRSGVSYDIKEVRAALDAAVRELRSLELKASQQASTAGGTKSVDFSGFRGY